MNKTFTDALKGLFCYIVVIGTAVLPILWPSKLDLVLNGVFWSALVLLLECCAILWYLYVSHGGTERHVRFTFGLLLVVAASLMFNSFEYFAKNVSEKQALFPESYSTFFLIFKQSLIYVKDCISFGIAAIGANLAAHSITEPKKMENA